MTTKANVKSKKIVWYEPGRCWGCCNCIARCAELHNGKSACYVVMAGSLPIPMRCMHCTDALCVAFCPVDAIKRQEDVVAIDHNVCIGCGVCALACPFGAISFDEKNKKIVKCDLCTDKVEKGEVPTCVEACPSHALLFVDINDRVTKYREKAAFIPKFISTGNSDDLVNALYTISPNEPIK